MNKLFTKIAALCLGATMAVGVGVAVAKTASAVPVNADSVAAAINFTVGTKTSGETGTQITTSVNISTYGTQTVAGYFGTKATNSSNSYYASGGGAGGIRVGKSSGAGSLEFTLANAITDAVKVDIVSYQCSSGKTLSVGQSSSPSVTPGASSSTYSFTLPASLSKITINTSGQLWITSLSLYTSGGGGGGGGGGGSGDWTVDTSNFDKVGSGTGYTPYNGTHILSGYSYVTNQVMIQNGNLQFQKNASYFYNTSTFGKITKITLDTGSNLKIRVNNSAYGGRNTTTGTEVSSGESITGTNGYFLIYDNGNTASCKSITVESGTATYTVSFAVNQAGYGTVSQASITDIPSGTSISSSNNTVTIGETTVTATPTASSAQYAYSFNNWTNASGTVTDDITITANFERTTRSYTVTWKNWDDTTLETDQNVPYGTTPSYNGATPTKPATAEYTYSFSGWSPNPSSVTGNATYIAQFNATKNTFTVDDTNIEHGSLDNTTPIEYGGDLVVQIVPDYGYELPTEIAVTMGGNTITASVDYNPTEGSILYEGVIGNIVITASCPAYGNVYSISTDITNGNYSGDEEIAEEGEASITIIPNSGYKLPASESDITVTNAIEWSYEPSTGVVSILGAGGNVTVAATCPALDVYQISVSETNGSHTGPSTIQENGSAVLVFTPSQGCGQPLDVTVSGATKSWNNGTLTLTNPTGTVFVTYDGAVNELDSILLSADSGTFTLGEDFEMPVVTAHYTVAPDATVTGSATYVGYDKFTTGDHQVTISYTEGNVTKTASYTATVEAAEVVTTTTWELTSLADLTVSDVFVITGTNANGTYAMTNANGTTNPPSASEVTITGTQITSAVGDSIKWNLGGNSTDGYVFYPDGSDETWLYATSTNNGVRVGTNENSAFTIKSDYLYHRATSRYIGIYNSADWRCYTSINSNIENQTFAFYKKVETQTGSADLIRITASYTGGQKYVNDPISTSDFTVKKQLNTGDNLIDVASTEFTISAATLESTSNDITVSYTENNITKTAVVTVPATERTASVTSVTLVQGASVVKNYVDWSGAAWDFSDLTVECVWDDPTYNETFDLADLVTAGTASVSPARPVKGVTSFTISYSYHDVFISSGTVSGIAVTDDYIESVSWTGKSLSHFKAFSGNELTAATVSGWTVKAKYKGAGETEALSFGTDTNQFTIKVGDKSVTSLPYTWQSADDGAEIKVVVGGVEKGDDHGNNIANICATINSISHTEIITPAYDEQFTGYKRISSLDELTSGGKYLIVSEDSSVALNSNLGTSMDANENSTSVSITDEKIALPSPDNFYFTITASGGSYVITSASGVHIGATSNTNSLNTSTEVEYTNTITFEEDGSATIVGSGGAHLRYNSASNADRFRYFKSETYTNQKAVQLYKYFSGTIHHDAVTETIEYANQMEYFDAQKAVVEFAKFMNDTMNGTNVCSGTFANLESAWDDVADKYDELFGEDTELNETQLAWAKKMLEYATAQWGSDAEPACVEKAMKTYEHCVSTYHLNAFMTPLRTVSSNPNVALVNIAGEGNAVAIVVIVSVISLSAIGGYFFLRKRKEN